MRTRRSTRRAGARQPGLRAHLISAWLLLGALYVLLIALLVAARAGVIVVAVIVALTVIAHYLACDRLALAALRARRVTREDAPRLHDAVERLCLAVERPTVALAVIDVPAPNAFTVGRAPGAARICVTTGLLDLLDEAELDAVLAHELAHVESRDVMAMTLGSIFASLAALFVPGWRRLQRRPVRAPEATDSPFFLVVIAAGLVFLVSYALTQALSRRRELVADRRAAALSGGPEALISALERISSALGDLEGVPVAWGELAGLAIVPADVTATVATMCPTHPSAADRRAALAALRRRRTTAA